MFANCFMSTCTCNQLSAMELFGFRDVSAPVGALEALKPAKAGNKAADVKTVQDLLNLVSAQEGGAAGALKVDGLVGPLTRAAIVKFQKKQFPSKTADGVVEGGKRTIYRLNVKAYPSIDSDLRDKGRASIKTASTYIAKGLSLAKDYAVQLTLPNPLFTNKKARDLLNFHFHLDRSTDAARDLQFVIKTLTTMMAASGHTPLGPNQKPAFGFIDAMPSDYSKSPPYAFTFAGGYQYLMGKRYVDLLKMLNGRADDIADDVRVDQIYLTRRLFTGSPGIIVYAIIHELGHFCGGVHGDIDCITDRLYFHRDEGKYGKLSAFDAITNADCYAQFCWETVKGSHFRP